MPTISVIIPCFNHAAEALACLASLEKQTFTDFEVILVDDGSTDGLTTKLEGKIWPFPFRFRRLEKNQGAPVARNLGFKESVGDEVIFLDADADLVPTALEKMHAALAAHPDAAFAYPSFKFGSKLFKGRPFDVEFLKRKNYIHTSALMRRSAFPGFDESLKKFQDWDLWLTIAEKGGKGVWIDEVLFTLKPRENGMSRWVPKVLFWIPWDVFGYLPAEVKKYRDAEEIVMVKHGYVTEAMKRDELEMKRRALGWTTVIVAVELLSRLVIFHGFWNGVVAWTLAAAMLVLTIVRPSGALAVLLVELLIGSKGALFKWGGDENNNGGVSLRILLFAAFGLGWIVTVFRAKSWKQWPALLDGRWSYVALAALIVYGYVLGYLNHNEPYLAQDANAWAAWFMLLPVLDLVQRERGNLRRDLLTALVAALFWLCFKTLFLFYFFGHGYLSVATGMYLWVRRTGVGEVTRVALNAFRIFFQSHIYTVPTLIGIFSWQAHDKPRKTWMLWLGVLSAATVLISLSRSFWIGLAVGLSVAAALAWRETKRVPFKAARQVAVRFGVALLVIAGILALPIPPVDTTSLFGVLSSRANLGEDAAVSRWHLFSVLKDKIKGSPMLGYGFGATVTYESKDPRIIAETGGLYTTYAFEWGWLEHWIKFGILGIPVMLWVLISLGWRIWKDEEMEIWMRVGCRWNQEQIHICP
jgi:glycosyltransferase involved in cell wall biosynthesis